MKQLLTFIVAMLLFVPSVVAQADGQLTQYFEVPTYYNPAAIGSTDYVRIRAGSRMQWIGIDNAPAHSCSLPTRRSSCSASV